MSDRISDGVAHAVRCLAAALLLAAAAAPSAGAPGPLHRGDPGRPLPIQTYRGLHPPLLPGDIWIQAGGRLNPAGAVPEAVTRPGLFVPDPKVLRGTWVVRTWGTRQVVGSEPWDGLAVSEFDPAGAAVPRTIIDLWLAASGRPVVVLVTGNLSYGRVAENEALDTRWRLDSVGALPPDALFVIFDWPSYKVVPLATGDINEKSRRGWVAGYHLARILQGFAPGTPVGLIGHSLGGRVVLAALHLMGGGVLDRPGRGPRASLPDAGPGPQVAPGRRRRRRGRPPVAQPGQAARGGRRRDRGPAGPLQPDRRGADALPPVDPEQSAPGARAGRPDPAGSPPARPAGGPGRGVRHRRLRRAAAHPPGRRGPPRDRRPDGPLPVRPRGRPGGALSDRGPR